MSDELEKKILVSAESKLGSLQDELLALNEQLEKQLTTQKLLELQNKRNTVEYQQAASAVRLTKQAIRDTAREYDQTSKAIAANNNSLKQNRSLLSSLTAQYVKLSQQNGKTAKSTVELGETINKLTQKIKDQEKAIGQTQRNVGNYHDDILKAVQSLGGSIPGLQQFSGAIGKVTRVIGFLPTAFGKAGNAITNFVGNPGRNVVQGFNTISQSAGQATETIGEVAPATAEAGEGMEGAAGAAGGLATGLGAVILGIAGIITYFAKLTPNANALAQRFAYLKGFFRGFLDDIGQGVGFGKLWSDMKQTGQEAADLKLKMQDLERTSQELAVSNAQFDEQIQSLQLKLRIDTRKENFAQEKADYDNVRSVIMAKYQLNKKYADDQYDLAVREATNSKRFTQQEIDDVRRLGVEYAAVLEKQKGLVGGQEALEKIAQAQQMQIEADKQRIMADEQAELKNERAKAKADEAKQKADELISEAKRGFEEATNERLASLTRTLEFQKDAFDKELSQTTEHYQQLIFKQKMFIDKQEELRRKAKSQKVTAQIDRAIGAANADIKQLETERFIAIEKAVVDHNRQMIEIVKKGALDVQNIEIQNVEDSRTRELAALKNSHEQQLLEVKTQKDQIEESLRQLAKSATEIELRLDFGNDNKQQRAVLENKLQGLRTEYNAQFALLGQLDDKSQAYQQHFEKSVDDTNKKFDAQNTLLKDQIKIFEDIKKGGKDNPFNDQLVSDEVQKLKHEEQKELSNNGLDKSDIQLTKDQLDQKYDIMKDYENRIDDLVKKHAKARYDEIIMWEQLVQQGATQIAENAISSRYEYQIASMQREKTFELGNAALTNTQRQKIEEKYRIEEGKAKQQEFKSNQKLQEANAIINLMVGLGRLWVDPGFPAAIPMAAFLTAQSAVQIATIAAQKPPAYAVGGVHSGDGMVRGPGSGTSDSVNARLSNGESVINAKSTKAFLPILSDINVWGGGKPFENLPLFKRPITNYPGFATGGVFNSYLPQADNGLRPSTPLSMRLHPGDISDIISGLSNAISSMPAPVVDVKDLAFQQDRSVIPVNRTTYKP